MPTIASPTPASVGLDLFAAALLERFREYHVPVVADNDGALQVWFPENGCGDRPRAASSLERDYQDGAVRELYRLMNLVPGGQEAVWQHVRRWPSKVYAEGALA